MACFPCTQICVAVMKPNNKLQVANLGDSGVRVVRDGRVVFASAVSTAVNFNYGNGADVALCPKLLCFLNLHAL
jgi:serine/threonine protein phosphatase PrpC